MRKCDEMGKQKRQQREGGRQRWNADEDKKMRGKGGNEGRGLKRRMRKKLKSGKRAPVSLCCCLHNQDKRCFPSACTCSDNRTQTDKKSSRPLSLASSKTQMSSSATVGTVTAARADSSLCSQDRSVVTSGYDKFANLSQICFRQLTCSI